MAEVVHPPLAAQADERDVRESITVGSPPGSPDEAAEAAEAEEWMDSEGSSFSERLDHVAETNLEEDDSLDEETGMILEGSEVE
jgi:hypothetical protein